MRSTGQRQQRIRRRDGVGRSRGSWLVVSLLPLGSVQTRSSRMLGCGHCVKKMWRWRQIWAYRGFISSSVKRDFQNRYTNSLLGVSWVVIHPLATILVYTVIFAKVMGARLPGVDSTFAYSIFLCSGVLTWGLFTEITSRAQTMFIENANLLKKLRFPKVCLPIVVICCAVLNFLIVFGLFTVFLVASGNFPGLVFLALLPLTALLVAFAIGLGLVIGVLNVFFRDVGQGFTIVLTFWFWLTPIVYAPSVLPGWTQSLVAFNPMASFMAAVQGVLVEKTWPAWNSLSYMMASSALLCLLGVRLFRRHAGEMVDEL